jgi:hypothetical protein
MTKQITMCEKVLGLHVAFSLLHCRYQWVHASASTTEMHHASELQKAMIIF